MVVRMRGSRGCLVALLLLPSLAGCLGSGKVGDDLSGTFESIRQKHGFPALAGAAFAGGQLLGIGAAGVRKQGDATPVTAGDAWHLGSDTKAMTATLAGLLVDEGRLRWADTLRTLFPGWAGSMDPGYRNVTVEMLLAHRGGAPRDPPPDIMSEMEADPSSRPARTSAVHALLSRPPAVTPGSRYLYSNAGYMMVGAALERITDTDWETLMQARLFNPLGMPSCGFGAPATPGRVDQPWGHTLRNGRPTPVAPGPAADNPPSIGPAGTVHCSLVDWAKFLAVHLQGARGESAFVTAATFRKLQTPWPGQDYALGWSVTSRSWGGGTVLTHAGSNGMFYAIVWIAPAKNRVFVTATNLGGRDAAASGADEAFAPMIRRYIGDGSAGSAAAPPPGRAPTTVYDKTVSWAANAPAADAFTLAGRGYARLSVNLTQDGSPGVGTADVSLVDPGGTATQGSVRLQPTGDGQASFEVSEPAVGEWQVTFGNTAVGRVQVTVVASPASEV